MIDSLLQPSVSASLAAPPADPADGDVFRIASGASGFWSGRDDQLAIWLAGAWRYVLPRHGMRVYDRQAGQFILFRDGWHAASAAAPPQGGGVIDVEARTAIAEIAETLRAAGIVPPA
ncbi:DUF2793 domain-containing protein [Erythrobacter sp. JK5]|uniref:DUF2793 domain-containing protein n=1 Tax=Erythrobacter sp. JK5 TaxID=2829500 RepID=UPI001BAD84A2|nr:DUF2793 domain-containing protein [Erythrobacter sp. JK5]QUL37485.1 DUF2793 domain-containing protein [Erythrobacter sp. JK5]